MFKIKRYLNRHGKNTPVIIGSIIFLLGLGFIVWQKDFFNHQSTSEKNNSALTASISQDYPSEAKAAMLDYQLFLEGDKNIEDIKNRREQLLSLTISREFQSLHLSLVMIADALIAGEEGDEAEQQRALEMISTILQTHPEFKL